MRAIKEYWFLLIFVGGIVFNYAVLTVKADSATEEIRALKSAVPTKAEFEAYGREVGYLRQDLKDFRIELNDIRNNHIRGER